MMSMSWTSHLLTSVVIARNVRCRLLYKTYPNFLQFFQSNTTVYLNIHVFCKSCEPEIIFVLTFTLAEQFHVRKSYKTHESTLSCIGNLEENIDLYHIHLAVLVPL